MPAKETEEKAGPLPPARPAQPKAPEGEEELVPEAPPPLFARPEDVSGTRYFVDKTAYGAPVKNYY